MEDNKDEEELIYDLVQRYEDRYYTLERMKYNCIDDINNPGKAYYDQFDVFVLTSINSAIEKLQRDIEFEILHHGTFTKLSLELEALRDRAIYLYDYGSYN